VTEPDRKMTSSSPSARQAGGRPENVSSGPRTRSSARAKGGNQGFSRRRRRLIAVVTAVIFVFGLVTARLLVWPAQGMPTRVDAIVMLAGPGNRLPVALRLAREHRAPVLVVSQGWQGYGGPCPAAPAGVKVICFDPDPGNTRGEVEFTARLAQQYRWRSLVLVTTSAQDTRARLLMGRCFPGSTYVVTAPISPGQWPYQIAYGWGALLKALLVHRAC